jgi:hypothetical protein
MESAEIARALSGLPGVQVTVAGDKVSVFVPPLDDSVQLMAVEVQRLSNIFGPRGEPAVEFAVGDESDLWPLIITPNDVVYAPASADTFLDSPVRIQVSNSPVLVAYSEMERDIQTLARSCGDEAEGNLDKVAGTLLLLRCFIAGAIRFGMKPLRAVAWWQQAWAVLGVDTFLPPFWQDPVWDGLCADAALLSDVPVSSPDKRHDETDLVSLNVADFDALAPTLTIARLDEEFVESWKRWVGISPARFTQTLLEGVDEARAEVALYPDGGGEVDLRVDSGGLCVGILQLGFSFRDDDFSLDEIRVMGSGRGTGLFQRLMFNTDTLAELLGFHEIRTLATGIGSYALAKLGAPAYRAAQMRSRDGA